MAENYKDLCANTASHKIFIVVWNKGDSKYRIIWYHFFQNMSTYEV